MSRSVSILGFAFEVNVETRDETVCNEVRRLESLDFRALVERVKELVERHGGCRVVSRDPLIAETCDGALRVHAEPRSALASLYWASIVESIVSRCRGC